MLEKAIADRISCGGVDGYKMVGVTANAAPDPIK
jgi:hypothetical protein